MRFDDDQIIPIVSEISQRIDLNKLIADAKYDPAGSYHLYLYSYEYDGAWKISNENVRLSSDYSIGYDEFLKFFKIHHKNVIKLVASKKTGDVKFNRIIYIPGKYDIKLLKDIVTGRPF